MATFDPPDYIIGNSATITAQLSSVLTQLDQALQALEPAPNATTVQFNDTLLLSDGSTVDTTTISPTEMSITDGIFVARVQNQLMSFDNSGNGLAIYIDPSVPQIYLTDGTTTNTIDKNGYTTRNTTANLTHYLDFSDNSATGTGAIQKTAGIECNPSTKTITATTFAGNATSATTASTSTNSNISLVSTGVYYPTFSTNTSGSQALLASAGLSFNATSGTLTTTNFSGNATTATTANTATNATNVGTTSNTTTASNCPIGFFINSSGTQAVQVNTNLNFQPTTNTLRATTFEGALTGTASSATNVGITSDNTSGTYYLPFVKTSGTGGKPLYIDDTTGPLTYNPSTATLTASVFVGGTINGTSGVLLQYNGTTQSSITTNGVQETLLNTQGTAIFSATTLTLVSTGSAPYPTFYSNIITFSGSAVAQTITAITVPTNMPVNGMYYVYITNSNTSLGAITMNATGLGTGIKTTYTSNVVIPISTTAMGSLTKVGASAYVWSINLVA